MTTTTTKKFSKAAQIAVVAIQELGKARALAKSRAKTVADLKAGSVQLDAPTMARLDLAMQQAGEADRGAFVAKLINGLWVR